MANEIVLIAQIAVTKASFVSVVCGFSIFSVEPAIKLILFTAYLFVNWLLDGVLLCAFKMCQGERWKRGVRGLDM
jgi:hypothetical protein